TASTPPSNVMPIAERSRGARVENNDFNSFPAQSRLDIRPFPSATCPREKVLPIWLGPDFSVVFEGYAGGAKHLPLCHESRKRSLRADILRTCCLRGFG